jgi:hypothetical protein
VVVDTEGGALIVTLNDLEEVPALFDARTVNANTPAVLGLPFSKPVDVPSVIPIGSTPVAMLHVIGVVPLAARASE